MWGGAVKDRLCRQVGQIRQWEARVSDYSAHLPDRSDIHYHVDPPFCGAAGRRYPHSDIDYSELSEWVRTRSGTVQVCESAHADWLPFQPLTLSQTTRGKREGGGFSEGIWTNWPHPSMRYQGELT